MTTITEVTLRLRYSDLVTTRPKADRAKAFTLVEVLISTGILLPLMLIIMVAIFAFYSTSTEQTLRAYRASALEQALNKIVSTCQVSAPEGLSHTSQALAVQKIEGLRDDGKLYWEKELWVFWLQGATLYQRRLDSQLLSQNGITISELQPKQLTPSEMAKLLSQIEGRVLADSVSSFEVSANSFQLTLRSRYKHEDGRDSHPYLEIVELEL